MYLPRSGRYTHQPKPVELYNTEVFAAKLHNLSCFPLLDYEIARVEVIAFGHASSIRQLKNYDLFIAIDHLAI